MSTDKPHNTNKGLHINIQPLRTKSAIETAKFFLSRNRHADRDLLLFLFGINTGLRASDIVIRKVGEFRHTKKPYIIEQKTGKQRRLNLTNLSDMIDQYIFGKNDDDWLFPSQKPGYHLTVNGVYRIMDKLGQEMDRDDLGTHTLRKTFGYHYYRKTHDIATLMAIFNHSSQEITKRYIGITEDEIDNSLNDFSIGI
ncbi:integrase [Lentilactobacillus curieae]|uniref:Integrase n=1 Tax=Lentilactobacillus curieae TaxID=1138822 RepID=A0A1S6QIN3_9LACO|nr:tyrosine-type recombinase/integrase [Lentilactobacillus curieae]AQW21459.1 integrase [Lentilactobacillus curieae]